MPRQRKSIKEDIIINKNLKTINYKPQNLNHETIILPSLTPIGSRYRMQQ